jgi:hypothetical protein
MLVSLGTPVTGVMVAQTAEGAGLAESALSVLPALSPVLAFVRNAIERGGKVLSFLSVVVVVADACCGRCCL